MWLFLIQKRAYMTPEQKQTSPTDRDHIFMFQAVYMKADSIGLLVMPQPKIFFLPAFV